ncbi:MAG: sel1 repeat family protein [Lachnospiraceae bacterium]|nr:sel1 repeat family protein [Lachnospiraceae bacterium]
MKKETGNVVLLTEAKVKKIARWEDSFQKIVGKSAAGAPVAAKKLVELQPEDLLAVIEKMKTAGEGALEEEWAGPLVDLAPLLFQTDRSVWRDRPVEGYHGLPCEADRCLTVFEKLLAAIAVGDPDPAPFERELKAIIAERGKAVPLRSFEDPVKENYILYYADSEKLQQASEGEVLLYVLFTDELCARKNITAMNAKAYACYGGNRAYACSWTKSRDLLLELMTLDESPAYANSLGYIYFYGRTNGGKPEYAKAFYYFSIGAAGGMYESRYKIADMFRGGYGVPKNHWICAKLINELYADTLHYLLDETYDSKFADIALRLGDLHRDGIGMPVNQRAALYFYLQARFAIRKRRSVVRCYGDEQVEQTVGKALEALIRQTGPEKPPTSLKDHSPRLITSLIPLRKDDYFEMKFRQTEKGPLSVTVVRKDGSDARYNRPMLLTLPDALYCGQTDKLQFTLENAQIHLKEPENPDKKTVTIRFDRIEDDRLLLDGEETARISGDWTLKVPKEKA